jgi:hypothetical protein
MYPLTRRLNLTLAGFGGRDSAAKPAPPPPAAVAPVAPVAPSAPAARTPSSSATGGGQTTPANVRNTGGARGLNVMDTTTRALKSLTGQ